MTATDVPENALDSQIGGQIRQRAEEIDKILPRKKKQRDDLDEEIQGLRRERRQIDIVLRRLKPPARVSPAVSDEQVLQTVRSLVPSETDAVSSSIVAEKLRVQPRNVARKLRKLVDDGVLTGDPERGYVPV